MSAISRTQYRPARCLDQKMSPTRPTTDLLKAGTDLKNAVLPLPAALQEEGASPRGPGRPHGVSLREAPRRGMSLGLRQPPTDWRWREFYYYPIITLDLCLNEACFLPAAISFYPGWRLKADQWGQYIWCHFNLQQQPPSFSLSEIHRKINSSQKWLKNA